MMRHPFPIFGHCIYPFQEAQRDKKAFTDQSVPVCQNLAVKKFAKIAFI
jgi:hypothetical protein